MQVTVQHGSWQKQWGLLVAKAWSDEDLKQRLIEDPATVMREQGIDVPYDVEIKVVEDTDQVHHLILPANPSGNLSDEELGGTVGYDGFSFGCGGCGGCGCGGCGGCDANS